MVPYNSKLVPRPTIDDLLDEYKDKEDKVQELLTTRKTFPMSDSHAGANKDTVYIRSREIVFVAPDAKGS